MPKFQVSGLKQLVDTALKDHRAKFDAKRVDEQDQAKKHVVLWLEKEGPLWIDALPRIEQKIIDGQALTIEDLPLSTRRNGWSPEVAVLGSETVAKANGIGIKKQPKYEPPVDLAQFESALKLITDEYVSASALKDMGFANLNNRLFRYLDATALRQTVAQ